MALISCPECGKEISDRVKVCPHCGYPLVDDTEPKQEEMHEEQSKKKLDRKVFIGMLTIAIAAVIIFGVIYNVKVVKPKKTYVEAITLLEEGKYEEANKIFDTVSSYEDVSTLQEQLKYESRVYECVTSLKQYLKNPDSLQVYEIIFYQGNLEKGQETTSDSLEEMKEGSEENPICVMYFGAQNGFGGNTTSYGVFAYSKDNGCYEYIGSCDSLDEEKIDEDDTIDLFVCKLINICKESYKEVGQVDLARIKTIIKNESYSTIKIIE